MLNFFGKIFFPRSQRWKQRRQVRILLWAVACGVIVGIVAVVVMLLSNKRH
jgi:sterol desaturase/sphingolipid hydroxylase (fatty acid hydroxylase superfamily)